MGNVKRTEGGVDGASRRESAAKAAAPAGSRTRGRMLPTAGADRMSD